MSCSDGKSQLKFLLVCLFVFVVIVRVMQIIGTFKGEVSWGIDGRYHDFWPKFT